VSSGMLVPYITGDPVQVLASVWFLKGDPEARALRGGGKSKMSSGLSGQRDTQALFSSYQQLNLPGQCSTTFQEELDHPWAWAVLLRSPSLSLPSAEWRRAVLTAGKDMSPYQPQP
jgi:hypothetical protein